MKKALDIQVLADVGENGKLLNVKAEVSNWRHNTVSPQQLKSIASIIDFVGRTEGYPNEFIENLLAAEFGVPSVAGLPADCYIDAIAWLTELDPSLFIQ